MLDLKIGLIEGMHWECASGQIAITDPACFRDDIKNSSGFFQILGLVNAVKGKWSVSIAIANEEREEGMDLTLALFSTWHEGTKEVAAVATAEEGWYRPSFCIGVDTGMVGVFDFSTYPEDTEADDSPHKAFYYQMCDITDAWIIRPLPEDQGIIMRSGTGDGFYPCYLRKNSEGIVDAIQICFLRIPSEEEESIVNLPAF